MFVLNQIEKSFEFGLNIIDDNHTILVPLQDSICDDFINPIIINDIEYSIQSPKYPDNYPLNIDCIHIIKAPEPNTIISIEFREKFEIEESKDCLSDFLQINDGPFGFSKRISILCGKETGHGIFQSSGRFVWLRFYSDATLTSYGFKIIYKFLYFPDRNIQGTKICYRRFTIPQGYSILLNTDYMKRHQLTNDFRSIEECVFDIAVTGESNIFVSKSYFNSTGMGILKQFIEIYDKVTIPNVGSKEKKYFIINEKSAFEKAVLKHKRVIIRISFKNIDSLMSFQFVLTALVRKSMDNCSDDEFTCELSYCISKKLICNNMKNCPNGDDEKCWQGKIIIDEQPVVTLSSIETDRPENASERDNHQLHGLILGVISLVLLLMLIGCIVHSIRQGKLNSKNNPKQSKDATNVSMGNVVKFEEKPVKPISSTITLTTDVLSKKVYNQTKSKEYVIRQNRYEHEPNSVFYKSRHYYENGNPHSTSNFTSRESCSPELNNFSKSTSNVNKYNYYGDSEHLPGCTSLPNFSAESVNNLFEDENYPVVEEVRVNKPMRMKYYA